MAALEDMLFVGNVSGSDGLTHVLMQETRSGEVVVVDMETGEPCWVGWYACEHGGSRVRFISLNLDDVPLVSAPADCMTCLVRWASRG